MPVALPVPEFQDTRRQPRAGGCADRPSESAPAIIARVGRAARSSHRIWHSSSTSPRSGALELSTFRFRRSVLQQGRAIRHALNTGVVLRLCWEARVFLVQRGHADLRHPRPFAVQEVAYFIPAPTKFTQSFCADGVSHPDGDPKITPACTKVIQTNNVELDDRGLIYSADRAGTGLHIIRLTGKAAEAGGK
jgi:hypothetical protein